MERVEFESKLVDFCKRLEREMNANVSTMYGEGLHESAIIEGRRGYHHIEADGPRSRFVRVTDNQGSQTFVRYFVEVATGVIFGAKGWKAYNPNHEYGTLDTINEWNWGGYYAVHKQGKSSLIPKAARR